MRSGPAASLSNLASTLQPALLAAAGVGGWQVVSRGAPGGAPAHVSGQLLRVARLADAPAAIAAAGGGGGGAPLLLVESMGGGEDVPQGCAGVVVTGRCPDVLSHAAVRARAAGVPLIAALDLRVAAAASELVGLRVTLSITGEVVTLSDAAAAAAASGVSGAARADAALQAQLLPAAVAAATVDAPRAPSQWCGRWVVAPAEFGPGVVGAKSANTARLAAALPGWVRTAASVALPLGAFEEGVLGHGPNGDAAARVRKLEGRLEALTGAGVDQGQCDAVLADIRCGPGSAGAKGGGGGGRGDCGAEHLGVAAEIVRCTCALLTPVPDPLSAPALPPGPPQRSCRRQTSSAPR